MIAGRTVSALFGSFLYKSHAAHIDDRSECTYFRWDLVADHKH